MWWSATDDDVVEMLQELEAMSAQVAALSLAAVAEVDRRNHGETAGATSTGNWLSGALRMRPEHAARAVKLARELDGDLAATGIALRAGQISADHAQVIGRAVRDLPKEAGSQTRAAAEQFLLDQARVFHPKDLAKLGRTILDVVDPGLADQLLAKKLADEEAKAERERELTLYDDPYSLSTWIRGKLDPLTTEMLRTALEPLAKPMPTTADGPDPRSRSQRLGDGFAELLRRYLKVGASPTQGGEKPHVVVNIDHDRLVNGTGAGTLLYTGTAISARSAQLLACDATVSFYVNGNGNAGTVGGGAAWLSDPVRLYTGKTRRLLELRDRGCAFPGCDRPPGWTHAHHIIAWSRGGPTTVDNGVLLCGHHHRLIHQGHWTVTIAGDRLPEFTPPDWIDPLRQPLRNHRLRN